MTPFNIELAKQGHKVCTRDGRDVRIICYDVIGSEYPIVGLVSTIVHVYTSSNSTQEVIREAVETFTLDGKHIISDSIHCLDLFMKTE